MRSYYCRGADEAARTVPAAVRWREPRRNRWSGARCGIAAQVLSCPRDLDAVDLKPAEFTELSIGIHRHVDRAFEETRHFG